MTAWQDVEQAAPEFAQRVRTLFDAHRHKTVATLRADASPRISGIETVFEDGELVFGSMPNARKGADLRRDPRFALHSAVDPIEGAEAQWPGEAKISGRAIAAGQITDGPDGSLMRAIPTALAVTDAQRRTDESVQISAITHDGPRVRTCVHEQRSRPRCERLGHQRHDSRRAPLDRHSTR
jgi:hypothetical protein